MHNGQEYNSYGRLDEIQTQLASELFVRCHKSFIVNLIHVGRLTRKGFRIGDTLIPISRTLHQTQRRVIINGCSAFFRNIKNF